MNKFPEISMFSRVVSTLGKSEKLLFQPRRTFMVHISGARKK